MADETFSCKLDDSDLVKGCAPPQPGEVKVGQRWMRCSTGDTYPVSRIDRGWIALGSDSYQLGLTEDFLRRDFVCVDPPDNVTELPHNLTRGVPDGANNDAEQADP